LPNNFPETGKGFYPMGLAIDAARDRLWWSHAGTLQTIGLSDSKPGPEIQAFQVSVQVMQVNPRTGELVAGGSSVIQNSLFPLVGPVQEWRRYADDPATLVRAFDAVTAKQTRVYAGPGGSVYGISVSADGKLVAAIKSKMLGKSPSVVNLWDADSAQLLASRSFGAADVGDVAFDPKGTRLAFAVDGTVHITRINP
jgi:WD40 repeat protein